MTVEGYVFRDSAFRQNRYMHGAAFSRKDNCNTDALQGDSTMLHIKPF